MADRDQIGGRQSEKGDHCYAKMANTILVSPPTKEGHLGTDKDPQPGPHTARDGQDSSYGTETVAAGSPLHLEGPEVSLSKSAASLITCSTRDSTKRKYNSIYQKSQVESNNLSRFEEVKNYCGRLVWAIDGADGQIACCNNSSNLLDSCKLCP